MCEYVVWQVGQSVVGVIGVVELVECVVKVVVIDQYIVGIFELLLYEDSGEQDFEVLVCCQYGWSVCLFGIC